MIFSADCVAHISEAERGGNTRSRTLPVYRMSIVDSEQRLPEAQLNGPVAAPHLVKPAWVEIQKPFRLFALNAPDWGRDLTYSAERHRDGGGRRDHLTFGKFGATAWLQITLYRPGMEEADPTPFFTDMARRAAPAGLAVARMGQPQQVPTRVGSFDVAPSRAQKALRIRVRPVLVSVRPTAKSSRSAGLRAAPRAIRSIGPASPVRSIVSTSSRPARIGSYAHSLPARPDSLVLHAAPRRARRKKMSR
jgi:hypothetical protein